MEAIKLNLIPTGALPVVHASQYDDGRTFRADLYDGAEVYHLDGTETISCELKKPDGNIVTLAVTNTSESFIEIQTTEQACAVAGESLAEVKIEKGADKIGSLNFILSVERSPIEGGISSASEINNLWTQVDGMVADILADSYDSANVIFDNLPTEGHGIPYTVTSEGIGIAIDDALEMTELASGAIATFESEYALPLRDLEIEINAVETGDGNPKSPSNPYTISGFTGANIHVADDETPHIIDNVTPITWQTEAGTVYGGSLDVTSGVLTVTHAIKELDGTENSWSSSSSYDFRVTPGDMASGNYLAGIAEWLKTATTTTEPLSVRFGANNDIVYFYNIIGNISGVTDLATWKTYLSNNHLKIVYPLATPATYQLTPTQISAIVGINNIFTDTNGDTTLEYYTKRGEQTVRIAEGVAVDVINNKSIDTLTTTDKTVKGAINELKSGKADSATTLSGYGITDAYTKTEVNNALALKFDDANRVTTGTGTFAGLLNTADRVWLITAQRLSTNNTLMLIAHKQNGNFYFKEIVKDAGMEYNYNSENGSVVVTYGGSTTGVYGGAYRLA